MGGAIVTCSGQKNAADLSEDEDEGALKPLPERAVMEPTAHWNSVVMRRHRVFPQGYCTARLEIVGNGAGGRTRPPSALTRHEGHTEVRAFHRPQHRLAAPLGAKGSITQDGGDGLPDASRHA